MKLLYTYDWDKGKGYSPCTISFKYPNNKCYGVYLNMPTSVQYIIPFEPFCERSHIRIKDQHFFYQKERELPFNVTYSHIHGYRP